MSKLTRFFFLACFAVCMSAANSTWAQDGQEDDTPLIHGKRDLMGEINIQEHDKQGSPYQASQEGVSKYFSALEKALPSYTGGSGPALEPLSEGQIQYLNALYLFCTINQGTCPTVLDAVLEVDIINSKLANKAQCPNMSLFWKQWVKAEMEQRQSYLIKTGYMGTTSEFTKLQRPRYIKCVQTIEGMMNGEISTAQAFGARYKEGGQGLAGVAKLARLVEEVKKKGINVEVATGAMNAQESTANKGAAERKAATASRSSSAPSRSSSGPQHRH